MYLNILYLCDPLECRQIVLVKTDRTSLSDWEWDMVLVKIILDQNRFSHCLDNVETLKDGPEKRASVARWRGSGDGPPSAVLARPNTARNFPERPAPTSRASSPSAAAPPYPALSRRPPLSTPRDQKRHPVLRPSFIVTCSRLPCFRRSLLSQSR